MGLAVDRVRRVTVFEDIDDSLRGGEAGTLPSLGCLACKVGGDEDIVQAPEGAVRGQGFVPEHVRAAAAMVPSYSALARASSSTSEPRAVLMRTAVDFIASSRDASISLPAGRPPRVCRER